MFYQLVFFSIFFVNRSLGVHTLFDFNAMSSASIFEHSYLANLNNDYLTNERLQYYQLMQFFTKKCPIPQNLELFLMQLYGIMDEAYKVQESQYLANERYLERESALGTLEKLFGYLFNVHEQHPTLAQQNNEAHNKAKKPNQIVNKQLSQSDQIAKQDLSTTIGSVKKNIHDFYNSNYEFREMISLNVQMKARPLIAILFLCAFILMLYRLTKKSESARQKIPKAMSIFWFFATIQLYLELNWLSLEPQPKSYSKVLFLGIVPLEQASNYIPEILNLLLFIICLFYFFSLIFRFNEIFGQDELQETQQYLEHINRLTNQQRRTSTHQNRGDQTQQNNEAESEDDFSLAGLATQPIMQVPPISLRTGLEMYHFVVIHVTLFLTFLKIMMLCEGLLFVRVSQNLQICTMDNLEVFPLTPRYLALFTVSFFSFSEYIGKTTTDRTQYNFQKGCPFFIAALHTAILIMRRRYLFTIDDVLIAIMFATSLSLYLTLEYRKPIPRGLALRHKNLKTPQKQQQPPLSDLAGKRGNNTSTAQRQPPKQDRHFRDEHLPSEESKQGGAVAGGGYEEEFSFSDAYDEYSSNEDLGHEELAYNEKITMKKVANKELQDMLFRQLREMSEEDTRKLFQFGGDFELSNDQDLIQKLKLLAQLKQNAQAKAAAYQTSTQGGQGGQGQQQSTLTHPTTTKQTAHKAPTKAPTGRPNPRKRR